MSYSVIILDWLTSVWRWLWDTSYSHIHNLTGTNVCINEFNAQVNVIKISFTRHTSDLMIMHVRVDHFSTKVPFNSSNWACFVQKHCPNNDIHLSTARSLLTFKRLKLKVFRHLKMVSKWLHICLNVISAVHNSVFAVLKLSETLPKRVQHQTLVIQWYLCLRRPSDIMCVDLCVISFVL